MFKIGSLLIPIQLDFELHERSLSRRNKLIYIVLLNIVILSATFLGYKYLPSLLNLPSSVHSRMMIFVVFGPVFALFGTIVIALKQPRAFAFGHDGIKFGDTLAGSTFYPWAEMDTFRLSNNGKKLKLRTKNKDVNETLSLTRFSITEQQRQKLQRLTILHQ